MNNVAAVVKTCASGVYDLSCVAQKVVEYLGVGITVIIGLAVATFVWQVYQYFFTEKDKTEASKYVLFAVIGFFVILSIWGLVNVVMNTFDLPEYQPSFPFGVTLQPGQQSSNGNTYKMGPL